MSKTSTNFGFSVAVIVVVVALVLGLNALVGSIFSSVPSADKDMSKEAIAERIKPVAQLNTGAPIMPAAAPAASSEPVAAAPAASAPAAPAAAAAPRSGQEVYQSTCFVCHGAGIAGAPKFGDKAAWAPRIAQGLDVLLQHAVNGFQGNTGVMPARGTCANCSDADLKAAIEYMVSNSK